MYGTVSFAKEESDAETEDLKFIVVIEVDDEIGKGRCRAHDSLRQRQRIIR